MNIVYVETIGETQGEHVTIIKYNNKILDYYSDGEYEGIRYEEIKQLLDLLEIKTIVCNKNNK